MIIDRDDNGRIKKKYNDDDFIKLCEEYKINKNAKEISEREDIPLQTLYYYIKKLGYSQTTRKHKLNENYFKTINTKNKAYILGFLMADGCVGKTDPKVKNPNRLSINISYKDRHVLKFIKKELECDYEIEDYIPKKTYSDNMMSKLVINSKKLCLDLIKLGVTPNKTGKESFPKIRKDLRRHFIRGFLDGDGWITTRKNGTTIGFISNYDMLNSIKEEIAESLDIKGTTRIYRDYRPEKNIFYLHYDHDHDIKQLKKYLYHNAGFYLERKASKLP